MFMQIHIFTDNDEKIEQDNNHRNHIIWVSLYSILIGFSIISSSYGLHHPRLFLRKSSTSVYISHNLRKCYFDSKFKVDNCPAALSTWLQTVAAIPKFSYPRRTLFRGIGQQHLNMKHPIIRHVSVRRLKDPVKRFELNSLEGRKS